MPDIPILAILEDCEQFFFAQRVFSASRFASRFHIVPVPSIVPGQELSNTWIAEMCLWIPWSYAGDLVAQDGAGRGWQDGKRFVVSGASWRGTADGGLLCFCWDDLVGGFKMFQAFVSFHNIWDVILPIDELIFFKIVIDGYCTTNQW